MKNMHKENSAFTLVELIVVVAVVALLAASWLPALARTRPQAQRITCANNLRQVGLAFRTWAAVNGGYLPMQLLGTQGGAASEVDTYSRAVTSSQATSHGACKIFLCLSNQLSTPKSLFCPAEYEIGYRQSATTFSGVGGGSGTVPYTNDLNVSYFVGVDASETSPRMLLTGDHNLGGNANPPTTAFLAALNTGTPKVSLGTNFIANQGPAWMDTMHAKQGNVGMADGSVEWFGRTNLQNALKSSGDTGRAQGSYVLATGVLSGGAGYNRVLLP
jgi:prepilin-type N-terminal cleavage/methylation domain-containing protein/prepilin-type processing-associated H-X9-DG protein